MKYKSLILVAAVVLVAAGCNKTASNQQSTDQSKTNQNQPQQTAQAPQNTSTNNNSSQPADTTSKAPTQGGTLEGDLHFSGEGDLGDAADQPQVFQVDITKDGFYPSTIRVSKGDYVQFVNKDSAKHWPASNPHPSHTDLPGFDAKKALATGDKYVYQFEKVGNWGFHDHMNPSFKGTVTVQ